MDQPQRRKSSRSKIWALVTSLTAIAVVAGIAWASSTPEPSVGLYWYATVDPTIAPGVCAPQYQLLVRTDVAALYAHTGTTCTAWTKVGNGTASGGTVTGTGTANTVTKWTGASVIGNSSATDNGTTYAIGAGVSITEASGATSVNELDLPVTITATNLTGGTVNNWDPTGGAPGNLNGVERVNVAPTLSTTVTGMIVGHAGQLISLHNTSATTTITLTNAGAGSLIANRFTLPNAGAVEVGPGAAITLRTGSTGSGWGPWSSGTQNQAGTATDLAVFTDTNQIGNYAGSSPTACTAGNVVTNSALSAAGALTQTCTAIGTAGGVTGTGTNNTIPKFTGSTSVGNSSVTDNGTTVATAEAASLTGGLTVTSNATVDSLNVGVISPTSLGGSTNDWNPTGLQGAAIIRIAASTQLNITGLTAPTGSLSGRKMCLQNISNSTVSLVNLSASSSAANRFALLNSVTWPLSGAASNALHTLCFYYDTANSRWAQFSIGTYNLPQLQIGSSTTISNLGVVTALSTVLTGPAGTPASNINVVSATEASAFDTTLGVFTDTGVRSSITSTRGAGANNLIDLAGYFNASGAQVNQAIVADAGDVVLNSTSGTTTIHGTSIHTGSPTANHGSLGTGSSDWWGNVTGVGANTSVTLTYGAAFTTRSWCVANTNASGTPEFIAVTLSATAPVFNCFNSTTGVAANCVDFTYHCSGQ